MFRSNNEGIEILTGVAGGERGPDGHFSEGTVSHRVEQRLNAFAEQLKGMSPARKEAQE